MLAAWVECRIAASGKGTEPLQTAFIVKCYREGTPFPRTRVELDLMKKYLLPASATALIGAAALISAIAPAAAAGPDGAALFRQRCASCHSVDPAKKSPLGPNLSGIVGRKAAASQFNYSPALKNSNLTWNRANLDRFLSGPSRMVPGTRMVITVSDPAQRAAILNYLQTAK